MCDRGRFGYEYVNSEQRILKPLKRQNGAFSALSATDAVKEIKELTKPGNKLTGIGSPRASLESNFLLQQLVGAKNFYAGISSIEW